MSTTTMEGGERFDSARPNLKTGFFAYHGVWAPGVRLFRALRFSTKALIISLAFVIPFLGLILWQLEHQAAEAMKARQDATRQHVEVAHGILVAAHKREAAGTLTREQAQALAKESLINSLDGGDRRTARH